MKPDALLDAPRLDVVNDLRTEVEGVSYPLDLPGAEGLRALREQVLTQVDARLVPRLNRSTGPGVVVLGGPSGAGKSTIVNAVVGAEVTTAGVLRPTTRRAVVVAHPDDVPAVEASPLARLADVVVNADVPAGLAIVDAPDLDSVHAGNRELAGLLLETADLWVFTTTASRYGDNLPWRQLTAAHERGIATAVVLNRVPDRVLGAVRADLLNRMDRLGLGSAPLFIVPDAGPLAGPLPAGLVDELSSWIRLVAGAHQREGVAGRTTRGVWAALRSQLLDLAVGADDQAAALAELRSATGRAVEEPAEAVADALRTGRPALGAPTTRWLALASTGGVLAPLVHGDRPRPGRRGAALAARSRAAAHLGEEVEAALVVVLSDALRSAGAATRRVWEPADLGAGRLLDEIPPTDPAARAREVVAAWRRTVQERLASRKAAGVLDPAGLASVVQAGAVGVSGAATAAARLVGDDAVGWARETLVEAADAAVRSTADPYLETLERLPVVDGTGLRLRASELKEHS